MYQPKNRISDPLPVLQIKIDHAEGTFTSCPNGMAVSAMWGMNGTKPEVPDGFLADQSEIFNPVSLQPLPGVASVISGGEAVVYRSDDLVIPMTVEELFRFMKLDLRPEEYFALRNRYGMFFEIHEDFYHPDTGEALQPRGA